MRVIAGRLGGRLFEAPRGHKTHPMSDKMRGALFNMLEDVSGMRILDAFAGSGALSYEAASRGASQLTLLDNDQQAQQTIIANIRQLGLGNCCHLVRASAGSWLMTTDDSFDLVLLDPPYDNLKATLIQQLADRVTADGQVVLSWPGKQRPPELDGFRRSKSKDYGDGSLYIYIRV